MNEHERRALREHRKLEREQGVYLNIAHEEFENAGDSARSGNHKLEEAQLLRSIAASLLVLADDA